MQYDDGHMYIWKNKTWHTLNVVRYTKFQNLTYMILSTRTTCCPGIYMNTCIHFVDFPYYFRFIIFFCLSNMTHCQTTEWVDIPEFPFSVKQPLTRSLTHTLKECFEQDAVVVWNFIDLIIFHISVCSLSLCEFDKIYLKFECREREKESDFTDWDSSPNVG